MSNVFVIDTQKQPLLPVHAARARMLLKQEKAAVFKRYPFTIILKHAVETPAQAPLRLKIDPGANTTGFAIVNDANGNVMFAAEVTHRGFAIKKALDQRRSLRRNRRSRHTRYRKARFQHRKNKQKGWLPPSLESRISNTLTWVKRLQAVCPLAAISQELVKFDTQAMQNPDIESVQYQQGTLCGYEVREYLLEKWNRVCAYCGAKNVPLQIEHIVPRAKGGSNRVSNLALACQACNSAKGTQDLSDFLATQPEKLRHILAQAKAPLKDAAAVNSTRWKLYHLLEECGLEVECGSGGLTKYNRTVRNLDKTHWLDACCVGKSTPSTLCVTGVRPLYIRAMGSGTRQMCQTDKYGFPRQYRQRKPTFAVRTGDMARIRIPEGRSKYAGVYTARVVVRASGSCKFFVGAQEISCSHKYVTPLHKKDGYGYSYAPPLR